MGLSGSASFAQRSRAAEEEAAAEEAIDGEQSATEAPETEAARLPRSYQMLLHLQQNGADAADADDPVLAITQAKAAAVRPLRCSISKFPRPAESVQAALRCVEAEVLARRRRSGGSSRGGDGGARRTRLPQLGRRSSSRSSGAAPQSSRFLSQSSDPGLPSVPAAVSALAHYTGGLRGTGRRKHRRSERAKTPESSAMQQFRVQSSTSGLGGGGTRLSWGSGASSNLKNAAWHHRLAQGRRSVELWREDTEPALVQRSASRAGQQGPERRGLVPLPAAERATGNWAALAGADAESVADSDRASDWEVRTRPSRGSAAGCALTDRAMFG